MSRYLKKYRELERERLNHKVRNEVDGNEKEAEFGASNYKCIKVGKYIETHTLPLLFKVTDQNGNSSLT